MPRPAGCISLTRKQIRELECLARKEDTGVRSVGFRARVILECSKNNSDREVATVLRLRLGKFGNRTVGKWRERFLQSGFDGLSDKLRPGAPRKMSYDDVQEVVAAALRIAAPTTRKVADCLGLNPWAVSRILRDFRKKVRDIVGLYMTPSVNALVLCVDEQSQDHVSLLMRSGKTKPRAPTLLRLLDLFISADPVSEMSLRGHRTKRFREFLDHIDRQIPPELYLYLIVDQDPNDETAVILAKRPRFRLFSTPTHAAWLKQVDRWIDLLTERQLESGTNSSVRSLVSAIKRTNSKKKHTFFHWVGGCHTWSVKLRGKSETEVRQPSQ